MNDIESFVLLKYKILTHDASTWVLCETYPLEVRKNWAWRCAEDVEHLATTKETKEVYRVARLYCDGKATGKELADAVDTLYTVANASTNAAYYVAYAGIYAAVSNAAAINAAYAADDAANAADYAARGITTYVTKWNLYINWLIEELCKYEGLEK